MSRDKRGNEWGKSICHLSRLLTGPWESPCEHQLSVTNTHFCVFIKGDKYSSAGNVTFHKAISRQQKTNPNLPGGERGGGGEDPVRRVCYEQKDLPLAFPAICSPAEWMNNPWKVRTLGSEQWKRKKLARSRRLVQHKGLFTPAPEGETALRLSTGSQISSHVLEETLSSPLPNTVRLLLVTLRV